MAPPSRRSVLSWLVPSGIALAILILSILAAVVFAPPQEPGWFGARESHPRPAFDFQLTNHQGQASRLSDFRGDVVVLNFGFTNCPNICPSTLSRLAAVLRALPEPARERVKVLFVSLDPNRDTSARLATYVPFFEKSFLGLTGTPAEVAAAARGFGVVSRTTPPDDSGNYQVDHSTETYVIDPEGRMVLKYRFDQLEDSAAIAADLGRVLGTSTAADSLDRRPPNKGKETD